MEKLGRYIFGLLLVALPIQAQSFGQVATAESGVVRYAKPVKKETGGAKGGGGTSGGIGSNRVRFILGLVTDVDFAEDTIFSFGGEYSHPISPVMTFDGGLLYWRTTYDTPFVEVTYRQLDINGGVTGHLHLADQLFFDIGGRLGLIHGTIHTNIYRDGSDSDSDSSLALTLVVGLTKVSDNLSYGFEIRDPILLDHDQLADDYLYVLGTLGFKLD